MLIIAAFVIGILLIFVLWLFWGLSGSDTDDVKVAKEAKKMGTAGKQSGMVIKKQNDPPNSSKSPESSTLASREANIRDSYTGFSNELFNYADGKNLNDVKDGLNKNITTFSDNFCLSGAKLLESKTLHLMFAASLVELVDEVNGYKKLKDDKSAKLSNSGSQDYHDHGEGFDSPMRSVSGSHTQVDTHNIELTKNNIMNVSKSLAESYGKCLMVKKDDLSNLFQTTAMYVFMYTSADPTKPGLRDRLRKEHDAIMQQLTLKM